MPLDFKVPAPPTTDTNDIASKEGRPGRLQAIMAATSLCLSLVGFGLMLLLKNPLKNMSGGQNRVEIRCDNGPKIQSVGVGEVIKKPEQKCVKTVQ